MTGAFYPAVDLCAGEKERGTLETLLSSPAERSEIVLGKLLTVLSFSMATAALNLLSVGLTGSLIFGHLATFSPPSPLAIVWLAVALVPVSALFSALCLALAAFARSTKEGQYYLMPLLLITLPLAILPMQPGVELTLGNSLIPITGIVLLLRNVLEGAYWPALQYSPVVVGVTLIACWLAVRWAVEQFNKESVLFRESEQFDLIVWLRHLLRDRQATPTVAAAVVCGVAILLLHFVATSYMSPPHTFGDIARSTILSQLVIIAGPALLMAFLFTRSPRQTLLLQMPRWQAIPAAILLAVAIHPIIMALRSAVEHLYPVSNEMTDVFKGVQSMFASASLWQILLVLAVIPPLTEEIAFRGFILSGFRHMGSKWRAILWSAILFGAVHGILQQSILACLIGVVLGYVAVQTGSILPTIAFHFVHNSLALVAPRITAWMVDQWPSLANLLPATEAGGVDYPWPVIVACVALATLILVWFAQLPFAKSPEEELQHAIERAPALPVDCYAKCGE